MKTEACRILFIGMSGAGKSYYGHRVADVLKLPFYDTDALLEEECAVSVDEIIEKYGEGEFRDLEEQIFSRCLSKDDMVLSTGGGIVERETNRKLLMREKRVIYLKASPPTITKNLLLDDKFRPLLDYDRLEESVFALLSRRERWYLECADIIIDVDLSDTEKVLAQIYAAV